MVTPDALVLELRMVRADLNELRDSHADLLRRLLEAGDRRTGVVLFPLMAELVPGRFTAKEVLSVAFDTRTPTGKALLELVKEHATDDGGLRAFGRQLARLEGVPLAGYRLVRDGQANAGRRWRLVRVSEG